MTKFEGLKNQLYQLYALTIAQRTTRLGLRAFWLGITGGLLGWGIHKIWGWLPNPLSWVLLALLFALIPIGAILLRLTTPTRWVQTLDQKLGFREEFNTAWEVSRDGQPGPVNDLLVDDVLAHIPKVRERTLKDGWFHEVDLAATLIIVVLACTLLFSLLLGSPAPKADEPPGKETPVAQQPTEQPQSQPQAGQQPGQGQSAGAPANQGGQQGQNGQNGQSANGDPQNGSPQQGQSGNGQENPASAPVPDQRAVEQALRGLGSDLSQQAGTYDLGQALQNMDMQGAAQAMQALGSQLDGLSPQSRDNLAQSLDKAASALDKAGQQGLAQDMSSAAQALQNSSNQEAGKALDKVAGDLRKLDNSMQASKGAGPGIGQQKGDSANTGSPEPLSRLNNEGGEVNLPLEPDSANQSQLLGPASPDSTGKGTASGSLDRNNTSGQGAVQSPLLPNTQLWKWRDVISEYFQR